MNMQVCTNTQLYFCIYRYVYYMSLCVPSYTVIWYLSVNMFFNDLDIQIDWTLSKQIILYSNLQLIYSVKSLQRTKTDQPQAKRILLVVVWTQTPFLLWVVKLEIYSIRYWTHCLHSNMSHFSKISLYTHIHVHL